MYKAFALTLLTVVPFAGFSDCPGIESWAGTTTPASWNVMANWSPNTCVPGSVITNTDVAIFPSTIPGPFSVHLETGVAISPGLNQLIFNSPSTSYTINTDTTDPSMFFLQFNGANPQIQNLAGTHTISANINAAGTSALEIQVSDPAGILLLDEGIQNPGNQDVVVTGPGQLIFQWSGIDNGFNSFDIDPGNLIITGGTLLNNNIFPIPTGATIQGTQINPHDVVIAGGALILNNSATVTDNGSGSGMNPSGSVKISAGQFSIINNGTVTGTMPQGEGAGIDIVGGFDITGGKVVVSNAGVINNTSGGIGSFIGVQDDINLSNGSLSILNTGPVTGGGLGALVLGKNFIMTSGSFDITNTGAVASDSTGSVLKIVTSAQISGGFFINDALVQSPIVNIGAGGTVAGNGIFQDFFGGATTQITNAGTVIAGGDSKGGASGSMRIQGSYTQTSTGTLVVNLATPSSLPPLNVTGTAQLAGSLQVAASSGASIIDGATYVVLTSAGGVTGQFAQVTDFNIGLIPQVQYLPNFVLVSFIGPSYTNYVETLFSSVNHINLRLDRQMAQLRDRFLGNCVEYAPVFAVEEKIITTTADVEEFTVYPSDYSWNIYFGPTGDVGRVSTKKQAIGYHYDSIGALIGFDHAFSKLGVGFLANYDHIHGKVDHHWGKFNIDQAHGSLYATYIRSAEQQLSFNAILGGGYEWYNIHRDFGSGVAKGSPQGVEFDALAGMEYTMEQKGIAEMPENLRVVPLVNLQYIYLHVNDYREHGLGKSSLKYRTQNVRSLRSMVGSRINYSWRRSNVVFTPEVNVAWQREYFDKDRHVGIAGGGFAKNLRISQPGRNVGLAGIDLLLTFYDRYGIEASYDFEWNSLYRDHYFYVGCNFKF